MDITLTEKGMNQYEEVIRIVFAAINKLKEEGAQDHVLKELQIIQDLKFAFLTPKKAMSTANSLASRLNNWAGGPDQSDCAIEDILYKPYAKNVFRRDEIMQYLNLLTPHSCYVIHRD